MSCSVRAQKCKRTQVRASSRAGLGAALGQLWAAQEAVPTRPASGSWLGAGMDVTPPPRPGAATREGSGGRRYPPPRHTQAGGRRWPANPGELALRCPTGDPGTDRRRISVQRGHEGSRLAVGHRDDGSDQLRRSACKERPTEAQQLVAGEHGVPAARRRPPARRCAAAARRARGRARQGAVASVRLENSGLSADNRPWVARRASADPEMSSEVAPTVARAPVSGSTPCIAATVRASSSAPGSPGPATTANRRQPLVPARRRHPERGRGHDGDRSLG